MTMTELKLPTKFSETLWMETTVGMSTDFFESRTLPIIRMESMNYVLSILQGHVYTPLMTALQLVNSKLQQSERFWQDSSLDLELSPEVNWTLQWYDSLWGLASAYLESSLYSPITRLERTVSAASDSRVAATKRQPAEQQSKVFTEQPDGYYVVRGRNTRRVSTFVLDPVLLLEGAEPTDSTARSPDAILCNVRVSSQPAPEQPQAADTPTQSEREWTGVTFTRSAFTSRFN